MTLFGISDKYVPLVRDLFISNEDDYLIKDKRIDKVIFYLEGIDLINEFHVNVNRTKTCQSVLC